MPWTDRSSVFDDARQKEVRTSEGETKTITGVAPGTVPEATAFVVHKRRAEHVAGFSEQFSLHFFVAVFVPFVTLW
jgi:hypothetical protein